MQPRPDSFLDSRDSLEPMMLFIGGAPRSGTSLVQKIVAAHPSVFGGPEFDHLPAISKLYSSMKQGLDNGRQITFYGQEELLSAFRALVQSLLSQRAAARGRVIVSEKTPDNVFCFEELKEIFPSSKFVFVVRDPRAVVNSMREVSRRAKGLDKRPQAGGAGECLFNDVARIDRSLTAACSFSRKHVDSCYVLKYEALVSDPETQTRKLCDFLSIEFRSEMLETTKIAPGMEEVIANDGVWYTTEMYNRPIDAEGYDRWRSQLSRSDKSYIESFFARRAFPCLTDYGFRDVHLLQMATWVPLHARRFGWTATVRAIASSLMRTVATSARNAGR